MLKGRQTLRCAALRPTVMMTCNERTISMQCTLAMSVVLLLITLYWLKSLLCSFYYLRVSSSHGTIMSCHSFQLKNYVLLFGKCDTRNVSLTVVDTSHNVHGKVNSSTDQTDSWRGLRQVIDIVTSHTLNDKWQQSKWLHVYSGVHYKLNERRFVRPSPD